jgi:hypothetical protein
MASSGIIWVDQIFNLAVRWLYAWAKFLGITYEEINVWVFCILWPLLTLALMGCVASLIKNNRRLRKQLIP